MSLCVQTIDQAWRRIREILRDAEASRLTAAAACRKHGISEQTFYRRKPKYGGMEVSDARRLKELEVETTSSSAWSRNAISSSRR